MTASPEIQRTILRDEGVLSRDLGEASIAAVALLQRRAIGVREVFLLSDDRTARQQELRRLVRDIARSIESDGIVDEDNEKPNKYTFARKLLLAVQKEANREMIYELQTQRAELLETKDDLKRRLRGASEWIQQARELLGDEHPEILALLDSNTPTFPRMNNEITPEVRDAAPATPPTEPRTLVLEVQPSHLSH